MSHEGLDESNLSGSGSAESRPTMNTNTASTSNDDTSSSTQRAKTFEENLRGAFSRAYKKEPTRQSRSRRPPGDDFNGSRAAMQFALLQAVALDDLSTGIELLNSGADPNYVLEGETALITAARLGRLKFMRFLLSRGASFSLRDNETRTALHVATSLKRPEAVKILIEHGADINVGDEDNLTPLFYAASMDLPTMIRQLIRLGANADAVSVKGGTALHMAVERSAFQSAQALIDCHANLNIFDKEEYTPLHYAVGLENKRMAEMLLNAGARVNEGRPDVGDPLLFICRLLPCSKSINMGIVRLLLSYGASFDNWRPDELSGMVVVAVRNDYTELAAILLENLKPHRSGVPLTKLEKSTLGLVAGKGYVDLGAKLFNRYADRKEDWISALNSATVHGHVKFMEMMFSYGMDPNSYVDNDLTCLHVAIRGDGPDSSINESVIDVLVRFGVDPNKKEKGENRNSPLHDACFFGKPDGVRRLIKMGAEVEAKNANGRTPIILACERNQLLATKTLIEEGNASLFSRMPDGSTVLHITVRYGNAQLLTYLLSKGAPLNEADDNGDTPLLLAIRESKDEAVKILLEHGANANDHQNSDKTPLMVAVKTMAGLVIVRYLLENGAQVNRRDSTCMTALHMAVAHNAADVIDLLLRHGADQSLRDITSNTPLDLARDFDKTEAIEALTRERHDDGPNVASEQVHASTPKNDANEEEDTNRFIDDMERLFSCPITRDIMEDPVLAADGHSYERSAIERWLQTSRMSPVTQEAMPSIQLTSNWTLRQQIESFLENKRKDGENGVSST